MTLTRLATISLLMLGGLALLALGLHVGCQPEPTAVERAADSTLAEAPAWRDSIAARDSLLAARANAATRLRLEVERWKDSAAARLDRADDLSRAADVLAELPSGISPHDSIARLSVALEAQKRATISLRTQVVPALQATVAASSVALAEATATIRIQQQNLADAYGRIDRLTVNLDQLRAATKHKGQWNLPLGIHLPGWTKDAVLIAGAGYAGWRIGRAAS